MDFKVHTVRVRSSVGFSNLLCVSKVRRQKLKRRKERQLKITVLPLPKGRCLDWVGDDLGQGLGVGDLLELGVDLDLYGDSPVLVHAVLLDGAVLLPLPHLLDQLSPGLGDLEVYVEVVVLVEVGTGLVILASQHPGGEGVPRGLGPPVAEPEDVAGIAPPPVG